MGADDHRARTPPRPSATFDQYAIAEIHRAAATGIYDIRGFGAKRKLLDDAGASGIDVAEFTRYGSARNLYHFHIDNAGQY